MSIYILFALAVALLLLVAYQLNSKFLWLLAILSITVFSALRFNVGYDYINYQYIFNEQGNIKLEPGYNIIASIARHTINDARFLFALFAILTTLFIVRGIQKHSIHKRTSLLLYIMIPGLYLNSLTIIRQSLAMAILFYGYSYYLKNKRIKFFAFALIAFLFHYSAILAFIIIVIVHKIKTSKTRLYFILGGSLLIGISGLLNKLLIGIADSGYLDYFNDTGNANIIKLIVINAFMIYVIFNKNELVKYRKVNESYIKIIVIGTAIINLFSALPFVTRLALYLKIYEIIVISDLFYIKRKKLITIIFIAFYISMFIFCLYTDMNLNSHGYPTELTKLIPYRTIFSK